MPRDGAITFSSLICKRDMLHVSCAKCGRKGRYSIRWLIEDHGRDGKVTDWLTAIGVRPDLASSAIRMSLGSMSTSAGIDRVAEVFVKLAAKARGLSATAR